MAKKLTEKALMKELNTMDKEELVTIISDLYKTNKTAEARLNLLFLGEEYGNALLEKYKKQLYKISPLYNFLYKKTPLYNFLYKNYKCANLKFYQS